MAEVYILREGELKEADDGVIAPATVSLMKSPIVAGDDLTETYILVDAGGPQDTLADLKGWLAPLGIEPQEIQDVVLTHNHPDHTGLVRYMRGATIYGTDSTYIIGCPGDKKQLYRPVKENIQFNTDVFVINTPGHENSRDRSVVAYTPEGKVIIAGDLFLNVHEYNKPSDFSQWPPDNQDLAYKSRMSVIEKIQPRRVVPGHGEPFVV